MEQSKLKLAQEDIEEALRAVEDMEKYLEEENRENEDLKKNLLKEKFMYLSEKLQQLESILKTEGII